MSGNVGSERRLEYTALGDTTNTAARLEGMTKGTPHQLYISDTTKQKLTRAPDDLVEVGEAEVRGRKAQGAAVVAARRRRAARRPRRRPRRPSRRNTAPTPRHVVLDDQRRCSARRGPIRPRCLPRALRPLRGADPRLPPAALPRRGRRARTDRRDLRPGLAGADALPRRVRRQRRAVAVRDRPQRAAGLRPAARARGARPRAARHAGRADHDLAPGRVARRDASTTCPRPSGCGWSRSSATTRSPRPSARRPAPPACASTAAWPPCARRGPDDRPPRRHRRRPRACRPRRPPPQHQAPPPDPRWRASRSRSSPPGPRSPAAC